MADRGRALERLRRRGVVIDTGEGRAKPVPAASVVRRPGQRGSVGARRRGVVSPIVQGIRVSCLGRETGGARLAARRRSQ